MNENIDLTRILEGCPEGTKFYSSNYGEVAFVGIIDNNYYPIKVVFLKLDKSIATAYVTKDGKDDYNANGECTFFPSKDQRDWSKFVRFWDEPLIEMFDRNELKPFDKVLARYDSKSSWECTFFSHIIDKVNPTTVCNGMHFNHCIPYNEETKHLIGTANDCPKYYKWWEV